VCRGDKIKIKFSIFIFGAIIISSALWCGRVFAFNNTITHPALTENIAKIYNANFERKLSSQEINWIKLGSIEEDKFPRPVNHFFEPNLGIGIAGFASSKAWAQNSGLQKITATGDYSWQTAINAYVKGDNELAFVALGHALHLLEDKAVPAHTRLDEHLTRGDPYEQWAEKQTDVNFNVSPTIVSQLNNAFDGLALYSNKHFLSKDTVDVKSKNYEEKLINGKIYLFSSEVNGKRFKIAEKIFISKNKTVLALSDEVHSDYFSLLAPKAVSYGAGVVNLFIQEAEKKKKEENNKSWWQKLKENILASVGSSLATGSLSSSLAEASAPKPVESAVSDEQSEALASSSTNRSGTEANLATTGIDQYSLPANTVVARDKITVNLPTNTVMAQEKLGGNIVEEITPDDVDIPSAIIEETNPSQVALPKQSPSPSPLKFLPGVGLAPTSSPSPGSDTTAPQTTITSAPATNVATTTATFVFGSSESDSTFSCQLDSATSTSCVSPKEYTGLSEGAHIFKVSAIDAIGNQDATPAEHSWSINLVPEVILSLSNYSILNINFSVNWTSSSSDVSSYDVQYKINTGGAWQDWVMTTTTTSKSFQASYDNVIYYFRVRATDSLGHQSGWTEIEAPVSLKPVIINEIMYNPNPGSDDYYEYLELYNRSPADIDLTGWQFVSGSSVHAISADTVHNGSSTIIASGGFALLTDKVVSATASSTYDGYYSISDYSSSALRLRINDASMGLVNSGVSLFLKNASNTIVDEVSYLSSWGANGNGKSLERINYNNLYSKNRLAWAESVIGGTPNVVNGSLDLTVGSYLAENTIISSDFIWAEVGSPYLLFSATVNAGVTLIIEPGTIIKPQNKNLDSLTVDGTLKINGTRAQPVLFTSKEVSPQAGDWGTAINFAADSLNSEVSTAIFEYGGYQAAWPSTTLKPSVVVNSSAVDFDNCIFRDTQSRSLDLISSGSAVTNSQFSSSTSVAIYVSGSSAPNISGNTFQNSGNVGAAIKIDNQASPAVRNNSISGFTYVIWLQSAYPDISGNTLANNTYNGIYVEDHTVISQNATWQNGNVYLLLSNSGQYPLVATSTTLTLEPGVIIKPLNKHYTALKIEGSLMANGNSSSTLINFTSLKDDSLGGDSNNDGSLTSAISTVGDWKNIWFADGSQSTLKFVAFQFGGFDRGIYGEWRVKEESLKIDATAQVVTEEIRVE